MTAGAVGWSTLVHEEIIADPLRIPDASAQRATGMSGCLS
jgi:hypothetical protein